jgi:hypothetical protein
MTIGRGEPPRALMSALSALNGLGYDIDAILLKWCVQNEMHRFANLTLPEAIENIKKKL